MNAVLSAGTSVSVFHAAARNSCPHTAKPWLYPMIALSPTFSRQRSASATATSGV